MEEKIFAGKLEQFEPMPQHPDLVRITERVLCQNETVLRMNEKLLEAVMMPMNLVSWKEEDPDG